MVDIIIAYYNGTADILGACLHNLFKHEAGADFSVTIVHDAGLEFDADVGDFPVRVVSHDVPPECYNSISGSHAFMLDRECRQGKGEHVLTLDSDCFPVDNGWLGELIEMDSDELGCAGILYPWCPPNGIFKPETNEWRISSQTCWNHTHVACQLVRRRFYDDFNLNYSGDDTGLNIPKEFLKKGLKVKGWLPSMCPMPDEIFGSFDPELNRDVCVIFGDKMYHHGGASRQTRGAYVSMSEIFEMSRERVIDERDASFILDSGHRFKLDREMEVLSHRMSVIQRQMVNYLQQNERLFKEN